MVDLSILNSSFGVNKMHKLQDQIETLVHEWVWTDITEHYKVEEVEDLNQDQVNELYAYAESEECYEDYVGMVIRSICDNWEGMQSEGQPS